MIELCGGWTRVFGPHTSTVTCGLVSAQTWHPITHSQNQLPRGIQQYLGISSASGGEHSFSIPAAIDALAPGKSGQSLLVKKLAFAGWDCQAEPSPQSAAG